MSIKQRQDELWDEGPFKIEVPKVPMSPPEMSMSVMAEKLGKEVRSVDYFPGLEDDCCYITYGSWDDVMVAYRSIYSYYMQFKLTTLPKLNGWRIELYIPPHVGKNYLLADEIRANAPPKGFR